MRFTSKWISWSLFLAGFTLVTLSATDAWARCRRGYKYYRAKNGRGFCCPPGTKGYYRGYSGITCKRMRTRRSQCRRGYRSYRAKSGRVTCCPPGTKGYYRGYHGITCKRVSGRRLRRRASRLPYAGRAGSLYFSFDSIRANAKVRKVKKEYFYRKRCRVVGLYHGNAAFFRRAAGHVHRVLSSRSFAKVMHKHHKYYRRWERYRGNTSSILYKLQRRRWKVVVNVFERTRRFPCYDNKADGHTNAFARLGTGFLIISKAYLKRESRKGFQGVRNMAKTVIHESLHTLGFSHRGLRAWGKKYNNAVPAYVGCVVRYWPKSREISPNAQARLARFCTFKNQSWKVKRRFVPWVRW